MELKAVIVSCSHTNTLRVFSDLLMDAFLGENKCERTEWEVAEEEPIYLNPVWVSSRPWTS